MINFNPGTVYVYNQGGTLTRCAVYISNPDASFEATCRMFEEALLYISGARDVVVKCCLIGRWHISQFIQRNEELVRRIYIEQLRFWRS